MRFDELEESKSFFYYGDLIVYIHSCYDSTNL